MELIVILACDPPHVEDIREALEAARWLRARAVSFLPLGSEYTGAGGACGPSVLGRVALLLLALTEVAGASMLGDSPAVLPPPVVEGPPVATQALLAAAAARLPPGGGGCGRQLVLGRGVLEWLGGGAAPEGVAASWASACGATGAVLLGACGAAECAAAAALLGVPTAPLEGEGGVCAGAAGPPGARAAALSSAGAAGEVPLRAAGFLQRYGLLQVGGAAAWWRGAGLPCAWCQDPRLPLVLPPFEEGGCGGGERGAPHRVAVLGGSFNPPTAAHVALASTILGAGAADEVWVVPCGPRPDKASLREGAALRTLLTALALEALLPPAVPVRVAPVELREACALSGVDLMDRLNCVGARAPGRPVEFRLAIGADLLPQLRTWRSPERLFAVTKLLVCPRGGFDDGGAEMPTHAARLRVPHSALPPLRLSSSEIRARAAGAAGAGTGAGARLAVAAALDGLAPLCVGLYVAAAGLYA
jgi:nicotinate (nicotinamide) nucleotide adenylyltransferase